ncbi:MAG: exonuclease SbcCD subunit D [Lachnospiraceae bacterium]
MKFIHIADVHLGAKPDAARAYSKIREKEIWESLGRIIDLCRQERISLLLISGDLFHRQPLLRELREANALFSSLEETQVVLCAGNHDYLKKDSYYRTFSWAENVHMILDERLSVIELPEINTAVYGFSYVEKERIDKPYMEELPKGCQPIEMLMVHGGDQKHVPVQKEEIAALDYDYIALGHIHKPQIIVPDKMAYSGALEPIDKNDTGVHGYISGEIDEKGCHIEFVPFAVREYVHTEVSVSADMSGYEVKEKIKGIMENKGTENIYKIVLQGFRNPDTVFDLDMLDSYGNIIEILDDTKPSYNFAKLKEQNRNNILGNLIEQLEGYDENSVEYRAMCEGVQAFMETRRG